MPTGGQFAGRTHDETDISLEVPDFIPEPKHLELDEIKPGDTVWVTHLAEMTEAEVIKTNGRADGKVTAVVSWTREVNGMTRRGESEIWVDVENIYGSPEDAELVHSARIAAASKAQAERNIAAAREAEKRREARWRD